MFANASELRYTREILLQKVYYTDRTLQFLGHLPDERLQLDHGHVGAVIVGMLGVVTHDKS